MSTRRRSFYGWGYENEPLRPGELEWFERAWAGLLGIDHFVPAPMPRADEIALRAPRIQPPASLAAVCATDHHARLCHSYGRSVHDLAKMILRRDFSNPPDVVAYPRTEADIAHLLDWCGAAGIAAIPFGGGSSVVGGVNPPAGAKGVATIDISRLDRVLDIDPASQAARVQAGALGPAIEQQLRPSGLTLRFFLQAWEFSSLGGWIATRAAGHFATLYTQIDDHVEALRVVTPAGTLESRRLPASGAGPSPDRMFIGSEGALGVITEAWVRLHRRPTQRLATTVGFPDWEKAVKAVRLLSQAGLYPANARLIEAEEARFTEAGDGTCHVLVLGFEGADHPLDAWMKRALELCADHGGVWDARALAEPESQKGGAAGNWRDKFLRGPYMREHAVARGVMRDTVETAIPWSGFLELERKVKAATLGAIREATGREGSCTVRFTHLYPDGPAPYFTWHAYGDKANLPEQFWAIKAAASQAMIDAGGTITHHHALGRDHRQWYDRQRPPLFAEALKGAKKTLDPLGVMNPGVIVDA